MTDRERQDLNGFLQHLHATLATAVRERADWFGNLWVIFVEAWEDPVLQEDFEQLQQQVIEVPEAALARVGLTGIQLNLKLQTYFMAAEFFHETGLRRWFGYLLRRADSILESLLKAVPGGEVFKEYKEAVEDATEMLEEE